MLHLAYIEYKLQAEYWGEMQCVNHYYDSNGVSLPPP